MPVRIVSQNGGVVISVKVVPGGSRDRIVGALGEELKIAVSKPPQDGAANAAVVAVLAKILQVPKSQIAIVRGRRNPHKTIAITGVPIDQVRARLDLS